MYVKEYYAFSYALEKFRSIIFDLLMDSGFVSEWFEKKYPLGTALIESDPLKLVSKWLPNSIRLLRLIAHTCSEGKDSQSLVHLEIVIFPIECDSPVALAGVGHTSGLALP